MSSPLLSVGITVSDGEGDGEGNMDRSALTLTSASTVGSASSETTPVGSSESVCTSIMEPVASIT